MPFTLTHVLAGVPVARVWSTRGVTPALLIGCMVPDWPLFFSYGPNYATTHSFSGVVLACLPLGLALTIIFWLFLWRPLYDLLPKGVRERLTTRTTPADLFGLRVISRMSNAVMGGAFSHIVWDAFTHRGAWGVEMIAPLRSVWLTVAGIEIRGYSVLQHGSSLIGLPLLVVLFWFWYKRQPVATPLPPVPRQGERYFWCSALLLSVPVMLIWHWLHVAQGEIHAYGRVLFLSVTEGGFVMVSLTMVYSLIYYPIVRLIRHGK